MANNTLRDAVVVAASCVIAFLCFGASRLSGQLFLASRERFNVGRKEAALPFILAFTVRNICGPLIGCLGNKFGLQVVTLFGGLLAAVSVGACFFVEDIIPFTVLWGGCFGFGVGIGTSLIANILHLYFKTNFNRMHGIFLGSGCIGSIVLPGITETLLKTYGTSGTLLILSGLLLHCIPAAMLLKVPEKSRIIKIQSDVQELDSVKRIAKEIKRIPSEDISNLECKHGIATPKTSSYAKYSCHYSSKEIVPLSVVQSEYTVQKTNEIGIYRASSYLTEDKNLSEKNIFKKSKAFAIIATEVHISKEHKRSIIESNTKSKKGTLDTEKHFDVKNSNDMTKLSSYSNSISRNFQVFLDPAYILLILSISSACVVLTTMFTVIVDTCRDKGITEDVTVLMTFAIADMLGRFLFGCIADSGCITPLYIYVSCCGFCGLLLIGYVWLINFYTVLVIIAGIGALMGGIITMPAGIIRNYIKKEKLTMALSSRFVLFGFLSFSQPSVIDYFRETLHSYDGLFYLIGSMCILSTVIALLIPSAARLRDRRQRNITKLGEETFESNICQT